MNGKIAVLAIFAGVLLITIVAIIGASQTPYVPPPEPRPTPTATP